MWTCLRWIVVVVALAYLPARARAEDPVAEAKAHFEKGQRLFKVSRYREALEEFKSGFVSKADPVFLFNIAQCHRLLGERREALTFYKRYLGAAPKSGNREDVERRIQELEAAEAANPSPPPLVAPLPPAPVAPPSPSAPIALTTTAPPPEPAPPLYKRWWVWAGAAALVAAGVTTGLLVRKPAPCGSKVELCVGL